MRDASSWPVRKSGRLNNYDYSIPGAYFITIVTQDRRRLFGEIDNGSMTRTASGDMVLDWWNKLPARFPTIENDAFIVMPNHVHGIAMLSEQAGGHAGTPLPDIVRWFKTMTTNAYIRGVNEMGWPAFDRRLWQRGYHDRILRDEDELEVVREYIVNNPLRWDEDPENTKA